MYPPPNQAFQGTLLFLAGPLAGRSFPLIPPETTLGRDPRSTIVIPDPAASPFHARFLLTGAGWVVESLAPQTTLMVNQASTRQQLIRDQDVIRLGSGTVFRCILKTGMPYYPQPLVPRPQQVPRGLRLSRRTVLIGGAALAGGFLLLAGGGRLLSSRFSPLSQPQPFQHVALGTHLITYREHQASVRTIAWSPNNAYIASGAGDPDSTVKVWNALDGTTVYTYRTYALYSTVLSASPGFLAWSPDGMHLVTCDDGDGAEVDTWDATDGGHETKLRIPSTSGVTGTTQVAWSPNGTRLAAACRSVDLTTSNISAGTVLLWDAGSAEPLPSYTVQSSVDWVAWSPDSQRIAVAIENTVQVLSVGNWQPLLNYQGHADFVNSVVWSPDGTRIASGSGSFQGNDNTVQVWDATNGKTLSIYRGHTKTVWTVTWSPDGTRIASGGDDWTVQVWNAADARQIYIYKGHSDGVKQVAWSPDGTRIASGSNDNTVQVWGAG
jgi:WD40 repeat protein